MPPRKPTEPTSISAFFLGGLIPKERVGDVLEMLYLTGGTSFQIDPQFDKPEPKTRLALAERALRQLPPPAPTNGAAPHPAANGEAAPTQKEYLIGLFAGGISLSRDDIYVQALAAGYEKVQVRLRLWEMKRDKILKFAKGVYSLRKRAPRAMKPANAAAPRSAAKRGTAGMPSPDSQEGLVLAEMRRIHPDSVTRSNLMDMFTRLRRRPESVSVALAALFKKGLAKHAVDTSGKPIPATYEYIPQPKAKDQSHGHQHASE